MLGHRKLEVGDYIAILKRRRMMIIVPTVLLPILAIAVTFYIPAQYLSQTLVLVEEQKVPDTIVRPVISEDLDSRLASMKEQILSRSHVQPIVERYNLYSTEHLNMDDRIEKARKAIDIKPIRSETGKGGLPGFFISFTASDARTAQLVCGEITSLFTNENLRSREAAAEGTTDFLKTQLAAAKRSLDDQDAKLETFQTANGGRLPGEETTNTQVLQSLNTQLEAANQALARMEQDKSYQESLLAQQVAATTPVAEDGTPITTGLGTPEQQTQMLALQNQLTDLQSHYTDDYPDVVSTKRKIAELRKEMKTEATHPKSGGAPRVPRGGDSIGMDQLRAQIRASTVGIASKQAEQANLQGQVRQYEARISSSPLVEEQYKDLTRDYETAQKFYDDLLTKMNQSKMATDLELQQQGEQFRVMDEPNLPDAPSFPNRTLFALAGLLLGLVVGMLLSAFMEYKDTALRSEQDVWAFTRLPTLAVLPFSPEIASDPSRGRFVWLRRLFGRTPKDPLTEAGS